MEKLNNDGFSLIEIMLAFGLLGALSVGIMQMNKGQIQVGKRAESSFELNTISNVIAQNILNKEACLETFGAGTTITNGLSLSEIRNRNGGTVFDLVNSYGNRSVKLNSITVRDLVISGTGADRSGDLNIEVEFEKLSKILKGNKIVRRKFFTQVKLNASDQLISCNVSSIDLEAAKRETCLTIGGIYDDATNNCNLTTFNPGDPLSDSNAVSSQFLDDFFNSMISTTLDPRYVNITGDTMTGILQVNAKIESSSEVCVDGRCRNFNASGCAVGSVVKEIRADGTVECANVTCGPTEFYTGITAGGTPICRAFPTNTCGTNEYISEVRADGTTVCSPLPPGTNKDCTPDLMQGIDAAGNKICIAISAVDTDTNVFGQSCPPGQYLTGFDSSGVRLCQTLPTPTLNIQSRNQFNPISACTSSTVASGVVACPIGTTKAISCGIIKSSNEDNEDDFMCNPEPNSAQCRFYRDKSGGCGDFTGVCHCI